VIWALEHLCAIHRIPFSSEIISREFPPPHDESTLVLAANSAGLQIQSLPLGEIRAEEAVFPMLIVFASTNDYGTEGEFAIALGTQVVGLNLCVMLLHQCAKRPSLIDLALFKSLSRNTAYATKPAESSLKDSDSLSVESKGRVFGFNWFVPELLRHKKVWRDVLMASAVLQILALATPLFTQAIIDKVIVHRTQSTLLTIGFAMGIFVIFTAMLTWVRQYLVLHTGNRVDAVLGAAVWAHLLKLPLRYFEHRPTGVVAARLHGVETIREFVSGAAVSLVLDLPFLVICLSVMFYYSIPLSILAIVVLVSIAIASAVVAPIFQMRLNEQFLLGARNQAFVTEHIAGFETVKSLQMEPQLNKQYSNFLATYLHRSFETKQISNTYTVFSNTAEQLMTLGILMLGAWIVMTEPTFTIGMLVAFQMFAGKLSQPLLRIVGLWAQFQQASLSVKRLGDVMNVPPEMYTVIPQRQQAATGKIEISNVAFRYLENSPQLFTGLNFEIEPGQAVAVMGPSGIGKSTLAKLLQGFYQPTEGAIRIDGVDIRFLGVNELRSYFGVVPQETILFSGSILSNLLAGNPAASFEHVHASCRLAGIHETIEALPNGYNTEIGERGNGLSGGQKQRLAIARALLKRPKILIFDEATSALDKETAEAFATTINQLKGKVTMLFVTHGLPSALKVDEVLQMSKQGVRSLRVMPADQQTNAFGEATK
jgi:ATP-binding cassette, subfamily B, bacterial HlyB/CyaB